MPVSMTEHGIEVLGRENVRPIYRSAALDGKTIFDYDNDAGVLRLNKYMFPRAELKVILQQAGVSSGGGRKFVIPLPLGDTAIFNSVRKIEYIPEGIDLVTRIRNRVGYFSEYLQ